MNTAKRISALQQRIQTEGLDAYAVLSREASDAANLRYLTGFSGTFGIAVVGQAGKHFYTDGRYHDRVKGQLDGWAVARVKNHLEFPELLKGLGLKRVGFNAAAISVSLHQTFTKELDGVKLVPCQDFVGELRQRKDAGEIEHIRRAQALTDRAFDHILGAVRPGMRESEVAWEMEVFLRQNGSDGLAFPIMVGSGPNSALPHHQTGERKLQAGEFLLFDFGARCEGYCADMTRTVCLGKPSDEQRQVYDAVLRGQQAALDAISAGVNGQDVDRAARDVIEAAGHGECFVHGTGHGVGLDIHEGPSLSHLMASTLPEDSVVTVEPGIYKVTWGGVRIEDLVVVRPDGHENLTASTKQFISV